MTNPPTPDVSPEKVRKKVTYFEDREASVIQRQELRGYLGMLLGDVRCRVPDCLCDEFKLYVHYRKGSEVGCRIHRGYENVKKELIRLTKFIENERRKRNEDGA